MPTQDGQRPCRVPLITFMGRDGSESGEDGALYIRLEELPNGSLFSVYPEGNAEDYVIARSQVCRHLKELVDGRKLTIDIKYRFARGIERMILGSFPDRNLEIQDLGMNGRQSRYLDSTRDVFYRISSK